MNNNWEILNLFVNINYFFLVPEKTDLEDLCSAPEGLQTVALPSGQAAPAIVTHHGDQVKLVFGTDNLIQITKQDGWSSKTQFNYDVLSTSEVAFLKALQNSSVDYQLQIHTDLEVEIQANLSTSIVRLCLKNISDVTQRLNIKQQYSSGLTKFRLSKSGMLWCQGYRCGQNGLPVSGSNNGPYILNLVSLQAKVVPYNLEWSRSDFSFNGSFYKIGVILQNICKGMSFYILHSLHPIHS